MGKEGVYGDSELSLELFCKPKKKKKNSKQQFLGPQTY